MKNLLTFWAVAAALLTACTQQNPVLTVEGGRIQGIATETPGVTVFRGIPYAAPPVGELRWEAPQPVLPWEGVKVCGSFGPIAWQPGNAPGTFYGDEFYWEGTPEQNEDCLYLNVWAPSDALGKPEKLLPVAFWIHGGAYMNGYGYEVTMDGEEWAKRGVILVTINYRLGVFGFLPHPELSAEQGGSSGNYGTMDQIAALRWVHENIGAFGGDPSRITIFGQSAGAMSVKNLLISPMSKDLMAGAIIQSGGGVSDRESARARAIAVSETPREAYDDMGAELMSMVGLHSLEEMRAAPAEQVFEVSDQYAAAGRGWLRLSPIPDGKVLTNTFDTAVYEDSMARVPVMIGYNKDDMGGLGGEDVDRFCAVRDSMGCTVYEYEFLRELPTDEAHPASDAGAFHSAELWFMFGTLDRSWRPFTEADHALSTRMLDAWTAFCRDGNPGWPAYKKDNPYKQLFDVE